MNSNIYSINQFSEILKNNDLQIELKKDKVLSDKIITQGVGEEISGFCKICNIQTNFIIEPIYSFNGGINFRETVICPVCGLKNRERFLLEEIIEISKSYFNCKIYIYEQVTTFYKKLNSIYPNVIGSEYLNKNFKSGIIFEGIRHEDAACLSFFDDSFDLLISLDVFEHVFDLEKVFNEAFRVLKPSGRLIFSIPFYSESEITQKRAEIINGNIIYLKEPRYHDNPISSEGSLVVYDIAWDCLDILKNCGFSDTHLTTGYNRMNGNIGSLQFFFQAIKPERKIIM